MSEDEFDNLPDLFSGVTDAEWSRMLDAPGESSSIRHPHGVSPARSTVSTDYGDEHFVNPEALAEIDRIETSLTSFGGTASARRVGGWFSTPPLSMDRTECPICRTQLVGEAPLIPNITLDSLIEKHIELLISAGDIDWLPQGSKYKDRASRKAKWKASVDARSKALKTKRKRKEVVFISSDDEDPYIEHSSQGTGQVGMVRARSNRRRRNSRQIRR
ncbi:hypothetical protein AGABI1DRAFT_123782 [Agaricus bisporus var. burnettii JB137-S8]|uniref:Uncharacterized protein n=1 Tax=Agaricus bisporus var. burnettii (strain JB137-S8 / ATCC MYA-4627 / FGSC 10392) TaxID=597362 RepID=K5XIY5_AGABU|nr:uncharacterized protein AGABI1DRAFT_123782 [Agaricus bisporus var. burnettii JB137-S8]EKM83453.1 hypothetical protein AGABI1DRAFT_123782 [Agaricus bisporus var. burnettii JB137-S8]